MSPVRGAGGDEGYADRNQPGRKGQAAAFGGDDDEARGTPDVFDAPLDDLKAKLSDMTKELGSLVGKDEAPDGPVADQADIDTPPTDVEASGMARLAGQTSREPAAPETPDDDTTAADRVALSLGIDDEPEVDPTDEALDAPDMLGQQVLKANLDGDLNDDGILDKFEDDLPADDGADDGDGGLEFANLDFDSD